MPSKHDIYNLEETTNKYDKTLTRCQKIVENDEIHPPLQRTCIFQVLINMFYSNKKQLKIGTSEKTLKQRIEFFEYLDILLENLLIKFILNYKNIVDKLYWMLLKVPLPHNQTIFSDIKIREIDLIEKILLKTIIEIYFRFKFEPKHFYSYLKKNIRSEFAKNIHKFENNKSQIFEIIEGLQTVDYSTPVHLTYDPKHTDIIDDEYNKYVENNFSFCGKKLSLCEYLNVLWKYLSDHPEFFHEMDIMIYAEKNYMIDESYEDTIGDLLQFCVNPAERVMFFKLKWSIYKIIRTKEMCIGFNDIINFCYKMFDDNNGSKKLKTCKSKNENHISIRKRVVGNMLTYRGINIPKWML